VQSNEASTDVDDDAAQSSSDQYDTLDAAVRSLYGVSLLDLHIPHYAMREVSQRINQEVIDMVDVYVGDLPLLNLAGYGASSSTAHGFSHGSHASMNSEQSNAYSNQGNGGNKDDGDKEMRDNFGDGQPQNAGGNVDVSKAEVEEDLACPFRLRYPRKYKINSRYRRCALGFRNFVALK